MACFFNKLLLFIYDFDLLKYIHSLTGEDNEIEL